MEYIKSGWKTVVGVPSNSVLDDQPNVAETVERLVERVETSTLLEDRRDACRALKSLSKTYRLEVGAKAMDALLFVLQNDSNDIDIVAFSLETLINIIGNEEDNIHSSDSPTNSQDLSTQFTEIFIKRKENVQLVLDLLGEFDFKIRWPTIKLLYSLLRNKLRECQDCILTHPMGISRMMDLLSDPREVIRNDALLLLVDLTKNNTNIQKIVAFENAFDRILDIITSEGYSDGGIIVEDCLSILLNLLKTNTSNQNFFKEGSYINRLLPFFDFSFDTNWNTQKINNLLLMFKVIRSLVSPKNPQQVTSSCQKVMNQNEVLQKLCAILMSNGIPAEILTETINCVAEVIRGNQQNQDYFSRVNAPIEPPKPVIVILLMSMINEKQPFELRCAVLYCFQCFLYKNDLGQAQIVETLLPTTSEITNFDVSAGQLLCSGFFSYDHLSNWFVAISLSYALLDNVTQKEQLLRVQLATDQNSPPTSLLAYCSSLLQQGGHYQRRVSLLMLLSTWLANSSVAVANFVSISTNVPYLTSQVGLIESDDVELIVQSLCAFLLGICLCYNDNSVPSFTKDNLCQLITNRIGREIFIDKLSLISKNEKFSQAIQKPQIAYQKASDVLFDYEFCNLFRKQEPVILNIIQPNTNDSNQNPESTLSNDDHKLSIKYKELIRQQDEQLTSLKKQSLELKAENEFLKQQLNEQHSIIQQLRDQLALLKAQRTMYDPMAAVTSSTSLQYPSPIVSSAEISSTSFASNVAISGSNATNSSNQAFNNQQNNDSYSNQATIGITESGYLSGQTNYSQFNNNDDNNYQSSNDNVHHQMANLHIESGSNENGNPVDNQQIDYLMNENRRLLSIIDQYKNWEQNYYAYYNQQQQQQAVSSESLSTQVNVSDSDISRHVSEADRPPTATNELSDNNVHIVELDKLRTELESIRKEQEALISLLGDQNLKLQYYEKEFQNRGLESVLNDKATNDNKSLESNQIQKQPSSNTLESTNLNYQQSIMQPVYENMMNELKIPSSSSSLPTTNSSNMINEKPVSTTTTSIAVVTATSSSSSSMNDNPIQQNLQTSNAAPAPTISLLPMQENHYSLYSHPPQYHHYMHHQQQQQMNQYPLINSTPAITTATVTVSTQQQQQQSQLYQHSNPEMHS